jgi:hypothetical protein
MYPPGDRHANPSTISAEKPQRSRREAAEKPVMPLEISGAAVEGQI